MGSGWTLLALVPLAAGVALGRLAVAAARRRGPSEAARDPSFYEVAGTIWLFVFPTLLIGGFVLLAAWCSHVMRDA